MDALVGTIALALGIFAVAAPTRAADIWGDGQLSKLDSRRRMLYLRGYRILGGLLSVSGILVALNGVFRWY